MFCKDYDLYFRIDTVTTLIFNSTNDKIIYITAHIIQNTLYTIHNMYKNKYVNFDSYNLLDLRS